ncbi:hypothetical protein NBT05_14395 [Aquimarina sp. ERC-38]|uniref:hypothetical protein n=1 Tax=Aquimarina sp. ERC-38 TaxID=2949996 RepID=UPI002247D280|nr:hypothetical protein [Aquimarina sp. ERC-38]UZO80132.1 hypothetical protein NBT05_14395 [Aquimarina sp. ERC-38]
MKSIPKLFYRIACASMLCLGTQCELDVVDNERFLVTGTLVDTDANSLSNINVVIYAADNNFFNESKAVFTFGHAQSDNKGFYQFTSLVPNQALHIRINHPEEAFHNEGIITKEFIDLPSPRVIDFKFDTGQVILSKITQGTFKIIRNTSTQDTLNYRVYCSNTIQRIKLTKQDDQLGNELLCASGTMLPTENEQLINLDRLVEKDTLRFEYSLRNQTQLLVNTLKLVPNENQTYEFEF